MKLLLRLDINFSLDYLTKVFMINSVYQDSTLKGLTAVELHCEFVTTLY